MLPSHIIPPQTSYYTVEHFLDWELYSPQRDYVVPPGSHSSNGLAKDFDVIWFAKEVKGRTALAYTLVCAWWSRAEALIARENQHGAIPVVLWAGEIVEDAMNWLVDMGLIPGAGRGISYATPDVRVRFTERFVSMEGCVLPSSAIMGGSRTTWKATYQIYAALCVNLFTAQRSCTQL